MNFFSNDELNSFLSDYSKKNLNFDMLEPYSERRRWRMLDEMMRFIFFHRGFEIELLINEETKLSFERLFGQLHRVGDAPIVSLLLCVFGYFPDTPLIWDVLNHVYPEYVHYLFFSVVVHDSDRYFQAVTDCRSFDPFSYYKGMSDFFSLISETEKLSEEKKTARIERIKLLQSELIMECRNSTLRVRIDVITHHDSLKPIDLPEASIIYRNLENHCYLKCFSFVSGRKERISYVIEYFQLICWLRQKFQFISSPLVKHKHFWRNFSDFIKLINALRLLCSVLSSLLDRAECFDPESLRKREEIEQLDFCDQGALSAIESLTASYLPFKERVFFQTRQTSVAEFARQYGIRSNMESHVDRVVVSSMCGLSYLNYTGDRFRVNVSALYLESLGRHVLTRYYQQLRERYLNIITRIDFFYENDNDALKPKNAIQSFQFLNHLVQFLTEIDLAFDIKKLLFALTGWSKDSVEKWFEIAAGNLDENTVELKDYSNKLFIDSKDRLKDLVDSKFPNVCFDDNTTLSGFPSEARVDLGAGAGAGAGARAGAGAGTAPSNLSFRGELSVTWLANFLCCEELPKEEDFIENLTRILSASDRLCFIQDAVSLIESEKRVDSVNADALFLQDTFGRSLFSELVTDVYASEWFLGKRIRYIHDDIRILSKKPSVLYSAIIKDTSAVSYLRAFLLPVGAIGGINFFLVEVLPKLNFRVEHDEILSFLIDHDLYRYRSFDDLLSNFIKHNPDHEGFRRQLDLKQNSFRSQIPLEMQNYFYTNRVDSSNQLSNEILTSYYKAITSSDNVTHDAFWLNLFVVAVNIKDQRLIGDFLKNFSTDYKAHASSMLQSYIEQSLRAIFWLKKEDFLSVFSQIKSDYLILQSKTELGKYDRMERVILDMLPTVFWFYTVLLSVYKEISFENPLDNFFYNLLCGKVNERWDINSLIEAYPRDSSLSWFTLVEMILLIARFNRNVHETVPLILKFIRDISPSIFHDFCYHDGYFYVLVLIQSLEHYHIDFTIEAVKLFVEKNARISVGSIEKVHRIIEISGGSSINEEWLKTILSGFYTDGRLCDVLNDAKKIYSSLKHHDLFAVLFSFCTEQVLSGLVKHFIEPLEDHNDAVVAFFDLFVNTRLHIRFDGHLTAVIFLIRSCDELTITKVEVIFKKCPDEKPIKNCHHLKMIMDDLKEKNLSGNFGFLEGRCSYTPAFYELDVHGDKLKESINHRSITLEKFCSELEGYSSTTLKKIFQECLYSLAETKQRGMGRLGVRYTKKTECWPRDIESVILYLLLAKKTSLSDGETVEHFKYIFSMVDSPNAVFKESFKVEKLRNVVFQCYCTFSTFSSRNFWTKNGITSFDQLQQRALAHERGASHKTLQFFGFELDKGRSEFLFKKNARFVIDTPELRGYEEFKPG